MRKIFITLLLLFATSLMASEINWAKDYDTGVALAKKEHKPILFIFSRHTCKYCVLLEKETLSDEKIIKKLKEDFISIIAYSDEQDYLPRELWRPGTPTIWFLDANAVPMYSPVPGFVGKEDFMYGLNAVMKKFNANEKIGKK